jgi:hypothetical protein
METSSAPSFWKRQGPGVFWFLLTLTLICIPGERLPDAQFLFQINFDKAVHAGLFGGQVTLWAWAFRHQPDWASKLPRLVLISIVWGFASELIQLWFIHNRTFSWMDILADATGSLLAWPFTRWAFRRWNLAP